MKQIVVLTALITAMFCVSLNAQNTPAPQSKQAVTAAAPAENSSALQNDDQKVLYTLGVALARNIASFSLNPDELNLVIMGLTDAAKGNKLLAEYETYGSRIGQLAMQRQAVKAEIEKKRSQPFMDEAAKEKGAVKTASGLIYREIKKGKGEITPKATDTVKVHYHGTLMDGTVFDSSVQRNSPATFPLSGVIPCWTEGVQKMKVGGKARLVCPSGIAYGDAGRPPQIPGGATLIFEVELLEITK